MKLLTIAIVFAAVFYGAATASGGGHAEVVVPMDDKDHTVQVSEEDLTSGEEEKGLISEVEERQGNFSYCRVLKIWRWRRRFCLYCRAGQGCNLTIRRP